MWLGAAVFVGCCCTSLVQAICQVQFDQTTLGVGVRNSTFRSTPYCAYLGVRYAEPPIGRLRFRHSVLHQPSGLQNYTAVGSVCPQYRDTMSKNVVLGEEDCLFANIYTPSVGVVPEESTSKGHPVLIFVHGGSYQIGDGERDINGVDLLVDNTTSDAFVSAVNDFASSSVAEGHANSREEVIQQIASYGNMKYPMRRLAKDLTRSMNSSIHPIYYLRFEYDGRFGKSKNDFYRDVLHNPEYGAMHGDELGYIFTPIIVNKALAAPDEYRDEWRIHDRTVELIVNFIKHGNPTPTPSELTNISWTPLNENNSSNTYLNIDRTFEVRQFEEDRYYRYWDQVYNCLYYNVCDGIFGVGLD